MIFLGCALRVSAIHGMYACTGETCLGAPGGVKELGEKLTSDEDRAKERGLILRDTKRVSFYRGFSLAKKKGSKCCNFTRSRSLTQIQAFSSRGVRG